MLETLDPGRRQGTSGLSISYGLGLTLLRHVHSRRGTVNRVRQRGPRAVTTRARWAKSWRRTAGRVGWGGGPGWDFFPHPGLPQAPVLQEGEGEHREQRMVMEPEPRAALEVVEPQLVLELLMDLLAHPARRDRGGEGPQGRRGGMVGEVVRLLAGGPAFADQPGGLAGEVAAGGGAGAIGRADPDGGERGGERPLRARGAR